MEQGYINFNEIAANRQTKVQFLTLLNLVSYIIVMVVLSVIIWTKQRGSIFDLEVFKSPLALNNSFKNAAWITVFLLKGVFAILPLINSQEEFNETVVLKIKYSFSILCMILSIAMVCMTIDDFRTYFVAAAAFGILKIYSYYYVYSKIKYHDDGAGYVSRLEFFGLHVIYSVIHGWISFFVLHAALTGLDANYSDKELQEGLGGFGLLLLAFESSINLAYYKDVIFTSEIGLFYIGVFYRQRNFQNIKVWGQVLFGITVLALLITMMHNWKSAFYTKYSFYINKLTNIDRSSEVTINNDVKFWLKDTEQDHSYEFSGMKAKRLTDITEAQEDSMTHTQFSEAMRSLRRN